MQSISNGMLEVSEEHHRCRGLSFFCSPNVTDQN